MQAPSKSKTWANEDTAAKTVASPSQIGAHETRLVEETADVYQPKVKNPRKTDVRGTTNADQGHVHRETGSRSKNSEIVNQDQKPENDPRTEIDHTSDSRKQEKAATPPHLNKDVADTPPEEEMALPTNTKSDADWLRSRTSRLLGLLEDDEIDVVQAPQPDADDVESSSSPEPQTGAAASDESDPSPPQATQDQKSLSNDAQNADVEGIKKSGRLFIRNLPFTARDDDLERSFSPFGKLEEVSNCLLKSSISILSPMMNIQIGTTYALHMMSPGRVF